MQGIKFSLRLAQMPAFQRYGAKFLTVPNPFCTQLELFSDPYWECVVRHFTYTIYHDTGTCKMGPKGES